MKKFLAIVLALIMVLAMGVVAHAATTVTINMPNTESGSTTGEIYNAYKIFDASISGDNYAYTISSSNPFYQTIVDSGYFTLTATAADSTVYTVVAKDTYDAAAAKTLAASLKAVITSTTAVAGTVTTKAGDTTATINLDNDGYYLITSSVGSALILNTVETKTIDTKNSYPTVEKDVDKATADLGSTVTYTISISVPANATGDIVVHDTLTGASYDADSVSVEGITVSTTNADGCTIEFTIPATVYASSKGSTFSFTYTATVEASEVVNTAKITNNDYTSTPDTEKTYNYKVDVYKYTGSDDSKTGLAGAKFVLYKYAADGTSKLYYSISNNVITWQSDIADADVLETTAAGSYTIEFAGLENGTYYVHETEAPAGYNALTEDKEVVINGADATGTSQVEVLNESGSTLPSTGGTGTTIFYIVGSVLVVGAGVLLVTKKRMSAAE